MLLLILGNDFPDWNFNPKTCVWAATSTLYSWWAVELAQLTLVEQVIMVSDYNGCKLFQNIKLIFTMSIISRYGVLLVKLL